MYIIQHNLLDVKWKIGFCGRNQKSEFRNQKIEGVWPGGRGPPSREALAGKIIRLKNGRKESNNYAFWDGEIELSSAVQWKIFEMACDCLCKAIEPVRVKPRERWTHPIYTGKEKPFMVSVKESLEDIWDDLCMPDELGMVIRADGLTLGIAISYRINLSILHGWVC